ncbi:alkaline phosphatase family protein [Umezawaea sp. NPDC059074]|uniref:alkaline phosphatase family protein n=1 Tax=Umezawaea sp. NPDC059074 TaxID=3346716 RepID=UPI0036C1B8E1
MSLLVLDVVGLTPKCLPHMPNLRKMAAPGFTAPLDTVFPAVTCTVQSTFLTGLPPRDHGIVGNGWYFRDLGEVFLWRQHNALVTGEKLWHATPPGTRVANVCWWYAMGAEVDLTVTPRPIYHADGRKSPDCYTWPPALHDSLTTKLGPFPLFHYWGPTASIASTKWIAQAAHHLLDTDHPDITLVYLPHLDYDLQRFGPDGPEAAAAATELDTVLAPLLNAAHAKGTTVVALSEYGITPTRHPIDINRALRREGLLTVHTQAGMEYLDPWTSRAFAVADHQIAHVYVKDPSDLPRVRDVLKSLPGVDQLLDHQGKAAFNVDHSRSGDLIAIATPDAWFTYYYWLDDTNAPDFARGVEIHRKPGYDPAELFFDPNDPWVKPRAALSLARKKLGLRYSMRAVPLDPTCVKGSHGRLPDGDEDAPLLLSSSPRFARDRVRATDVKQLLLDHLEESWPDR